MGQVAANQSPGSFPALLRINTPSYWPSSPGPLLLDFLTFLANESKQSWPTLHAFLSFSQGRTYPASPPIVERIHDVVSFLCPVRAFPFVRVGELSKDIGLTVKCWGKGLNNDIGKELLA